VRTDSRWYLCVVNGDCDRDQKEKKIHNNYCSTKSVRQKSKFEKEKVCKKYTITHSSTKSILLVAKKGDRSTDWSSGKQKLKRSSVVNFGPLLEKSYCIN
jgi:hypothetical protein